MFIDASAFVAILTHERHAAELKDAIYDAGSPLTSGLAVYEAALAIRRSREIPLAEAEVLLRSFIGLARITTISIADAEAREALAAFARFGKGQGHPARLNMGDCFAYACARTHDVPLLFVGENFTRTDIRDARA